MPRPLRFLPFAQHSMEGGGGVGGGGGADVTYGYRTTSAGPQRSAPSPAALAALQAFTGDSSALAALRGVQRAKEAMVQLGEQARLREEERYFNGTWYASHTHTRHTHTHTHTLTHTHSLTHSLIH